MKILVFAENWDGIFKKSSFEAVSYSRELAEQNNYELITLCFNNVSKEELNKLSKYGSSIVITTNPIHKVDSISMSKMISDITIEHDIQLFVFSSTYSSKMFAPRLSAKLNSSIFTNVVQLPSSLNPLKLKKKVFSSKAFEIAKSSSEKNIIMLHPNSYGVKEFSSDLKLSEFTTESNTEIEIINIEKSSGKVNLSEADIVVSAGRGMKGPENWVLIEELANCLNAATACSKPVSDIGWRPHSEHVGQTGKTVAPNLYFAIGISGAIQHLAGVNSSKVMVAINTDPEASFFKAAHYGIVGDAFDVVPKLIEEIKNIKN